MKGRGAQLIRFGSLPPALFFVLAAVFIIHAGEAALPPANLYEQFHVVIPASKQPFPEPLPPGSQPGFKFRGTKGYAWTPEQYLEEIPWLAKFKMNFLMNCYVSMFASSHPWKNEWWKPLPAAKRAAYAKVIRACRQQGIIFCFCLNPQLASERPLNPTNTGDLDLLFQHYVWAQNQGVKWFSICVDDAQWHHDKPSAVAAADAQMVNTILGRLREKDSKAQMIFCPRPYCGDGTAPRDHAYLATLGNDLNPDVYVFWTGDATVTRRITVVAAESFKTAVRHRLFLWDNYPVNDGHPTLNLGPVCGRAPDLDQVVDGYMSNPMETQSQINRLPLATCADYAYNPRAYDPSRSISQAILLLADTLPQREALRDLVETYPGFLICPGGTGSNPVRAQFDRILALPNAHPAALAYVEHLKGISYRLKTAFPDSYHAAQAVLDKDVQVLTEKLAKEYN